jgi:RNA polymerase sigma-70 factor (ECF subfamily)
MKRPGGGDPFNDLVDAEREGLFRYLYWLLHDREDALDALQDVLLRAYRGWDSLRDPTRARNWIYTIAANVARRSRQKRRRLPMPLGRLGTEDDLRGEVLASSEGTPAAELEARDAKRRLSEAIASLDEELREPLLLFVVAGLKYREIAEALGIPIGTVTSRIHAAREKLASILRAR